MASKAFRKFILERQYLGKQEECLHNWFCIKEPVEVPLAATDGRKTCFLSDEDHSVVCIATEAKVIMWHNLKRWRAHDLQPEVTAFDIVLKQDSVLFILTKDKENVQSTYTINTADLTMERREETPNFKPLKYKHMFLCTKSSTDPMLDFLGDVQIGHLANHNYLSPVGCVYTKDSYFVLDDTGIVLEKRSLATGSQTWKAKLRQQGTKVFAGEHGYCLVSYGLDADIFDTESGTLFKSIVAEKFTFGALIGWADKRIRQVIFGSDKIFILRDPSTVDVCYFKEGLMNVGRVSSNMAMSAIMLSPGEDFLLAISCEANGTRSGKVIDVSSIDNIGKLFWKPRENSFRLPNGCRVLHLTREGLLVEHEKEIEGEMKRCFSYFLVNKTAENFPLVKEAKTIKKSYSTDKEEMCEDLTPRDEADSEEDTVNQEVPKPRKKGICTIH